MATKLHHRIHPRTSLVPTGLAFFLGPTAHVIDQLLFVRAGPIPIVVTAPVIATLFYAARTDTTTRQGLALLAWGAISSGAAILGVYL